MLLHDRFPGSGFEWWLASQPLPPAATERVKIAGRCRNLIGQEELGRCAKSTGLLPGIDRVAAEAIEQWA
jgi:hypothetical protein